MSQRPLDALGAIRLGIMAEDADGILAAAPNDHVNPYVRERGTSMAVPFVTGVIALMLEKYKRNYLDPLNLTVDEHAFWNSTAKALLIHTATDMIKESSYPLEPNNPDTKKTIVYHKGPDYATGWGLVNAKKAIDYVDTTLFKQDSIDNKELITYRFTKSERGDCRVSLAWDDAVAEGLAEHRFETATHSKLVNDLDLHVIGPAPLYTIYRPWILDPLPQPASIFLDTASFRKSGGEDPIDSLDIKPARRGVDNRNNVEVVDIENAPPGEYTVVVTGTEFGWAKQLQHFSLVSDHRLEKVLIDTLDWRSKFRNMKNGDTLLVPRGSYTLYGSHCVVDTNAKNVTLIFQDSTELYLTDGAEIWVGPLGQIIGAENVIVSSRILQYKTPFPREPLRTDKIVGVFGDLCTALWRGGGGRTTKVGPGIFNLNYLNNEGVIGTLDPRYPDSASVILKALEGAAPNCMGLTVRPDTVSGTTLMKNFRIMLGGDAYAQSRDGKIAFGAYPRAGINVTFENCHFEAIYSNPANRDSVGAMQVGWKDSLLTGRVTFLNCNFKGLGTAIRVNSRAPFGNMLIISNSSFFDNKTDLEFIDSSSVFCGVGANYMNNLLVGRTRLTGAYEINNFFNSKCSLLGIATSPPDRFGSYMGLVDPLVYDYRLTATSPLVAAAPDLDDIGAYGMNQIFTFSRFLDGRVDFGGGRLVQFEGGELTINTLGSAAVFEARHTLNLRPIYELKLKGDVVRKPSTVTTWANSALPSPSLPNGYVVWDAAMNGVQFAKLHFIELPSSGPVSRSAVPDTVAPAPVSGIGVVEENGDVVLTWNRSLEPDAARYKIFRASSVTPYLAAQIASVPAQVTEYRDANRTIGDNIYKVVVYDSTGNMSEQPEGGSKVYGFSGFWASRSDTLRVSPSGVTVQIQNPDYLHGAMVTVRNRGHNDSLVVEWYGCTDQNSSNCVSRRAELFGNGAQINNFTSPKRGNGTVFVNIRSATAETYLADIEIFNWVNGPGCQ